MSYEVVTLMSTDFSPVEEQAIGVAPVKANPQVSVLVPVYNEEESLPALYDKLVTSLDSLGRSWEVILVDDGSRDLSWQLLTEMAAKDSRLRCVRFVRNFGQTASLAAGIDFANGDIIIPMDADLQNDPVDITRLLDKLDEGYDVVSGWRKDRLYHAGITVGEWILREL